MFRCGSLPTDGCGSSSDGPMHKVNFDAKNDYKASNGDSFFLDQWDWGAVVS
ncbi:hypothetical protein Patl1_10303 [Pistacia atlantica]|uniref:Uncharacterized protein n=1 Tax=Pistacia atlantica TaxID=434234 RepID=A0ACC1A3L5_9ROSI|nr:hypothetical protein Patl1_10303 [Pistacia atlantica]